MEMSNTFGIPESLHVAQQRRRDKLRFQHFEELQANSNFHHHNNSSNNNNSSTSVTVASPMMVLSPEMFNFSPNIHPTRFIAPSSSDSCDHHHQQQHHQQPQQNWVPSFGLGYNTQDDHSVAGVEYQNGVQSWGGCGNGNSELALLPGNFVGHPLNEAIASTYSNPRHGRGLSLSLASNEICGGEYQLMGEPQQQQRESKPFELGNMSSSSSVMKVESGSSSHHVQDVVGGGSVQVHHRSSVGPLGPFTGYAAILKNSKFLKPAQHLLDELFGAAAVWRVGDDSDNDLNNNSTSHDIGDCSAAAMGSKTRGPMNELSGRSGFCEESYIVPDCYERKAKLLHMQEEVCKRQKQYHQQMQMVLSAFESVPGLSNATPYILRSLKTMSRHFRCLKNAIADQIKHLKRALGEDLSSPVSFLKGDSSCSLRSDNFAKVKSGAVGGTSHVWRPQRGLPERAVSVLRAWLFDHFLHPYPTDNDKQMLATQTGLTRNQVSNWFINARVRLWKPMVEEIHTLETKAPPRSEASSSNSAMSAVIAKNRQLTATGNKFSRCKPPLSPACDNMQLECSGPSNSLERSRGRETSTEQLFQKCSRIETNHQVPGSMDNSPFISFLPYQRRGLDLGEIGVVSLTLGLKHGSDTNQQQLQHQFIPQGVPFGGHIIHDFSA